MDPLQETENEAFAFQDLEETRTPAVYRFCQFLDSQESQPSVPVPLKSKNVETLIDMAARRVAQTYSCADLENQQPPLDEYMLCKVSYWSFPQDLKQLQAVIAVGDNTMDEMTAWSEGATMYKNGRLKEMWQVGCMLTAHICKCETSDQTQEVTVSLTFEKQSISTGTCSDCEEVIWCPHMICAAIHRMKHPEKANLFAPLADTLFTMKREQLQKLLQYAVQEDPAAMIGKLFRHIAEIRDPNSEMNKIAGAPDPTFCASTSQDANWQASLKEFEENFAMELDDYGREARCYDLSDKLNQPVYCYIRKILDLVQAGDRMAAIDVLNRITGRIITDMSLYGAENHKYDRLCFELSRLYTLFMLYFGYQVECKKLLLNHIKSHQLATKNMKNNKAIQSKWADLPSTVEACGFIPVDHLKNGLFLEPLSAQTVAYWPFDLMKLLNGEVSVAQSTYKEDVRLMLARLECLLTLGESSVSCEKIGRLSAHILRHLLRISMTTLRMSENSFSPLMHALLTLEIRPPQNLWIDKILEKTLGNLEVLDDDLAQGYVGFNHNLNQKRRSDNMESCCPLPLKKRAKHNEDSAGFFSPFDGSLVYALLYCCSNLIMCLESFQESVEDEDVIAGCCTWALEVSRYGWTGKRSSKENEAAENKYLEKLEKVLQRYLVSHPEPAMRAMMSFIEVCKIDQVNQYKGSYPHVLIDVMFSLERKNRTRPWSCHDLFYVCSHLILGIDDPSNIQQSVPGRSNAQNLVNGNFQSFIETFFSSLDMDRNDEMDLALQVLDQFEKYSCKIQLCTVRKNIVKHKHKFEKNMVFLQKCLSLCLRALSECSGDPTYCNSSYICDLVGKLGVQSLTLLLDKWQKILTESEVVKLIDALNLRKNPGMLPQEAKQFLNEYFQWPEPHSAENCMALLECYNVESTNYREVVKMILENSSCYAPETLFNIARGELELCSKNQATGRFMVPDAFHFVEKAILVQASKGHLSEETSNHLKWTYMMCINEPSTSSLTGGYLEKVVKAIKTTIFPAMIESILSFAMENSSIQPIVTPLHSSLLDAYKFFYTWSVGLPSTYERVITEMKESLEKCTLWIPQGEKRFHAEVICYLRATHRGKKKLLRMLDDAFIAPTTSPNADTCKDAATLAQGNDVVDFFHGIDLSETEEILSNNIPFYL